MFSSVFMGTLARITYANCLLDLRCQIYDEIKLDLNL